MDRSNEAASSSGHTHRLVTDLQAQITDSDAERSRQLLELESRLERVQQELRDLTEQSNLTTASVKQISQQTRTMLLLGWVSAALAAVSLLVLVVILSRISH